MAQFTTLRSETVYDVTGPDGQFISRGLTGAAIMSPAAAYDNNGNSIITADHWPAGSCAWLTQCQDESDDTEPADIAS